MIGIREGVTLLLLTLGVAFAFLASLGVVRMPDLFTRMQTTTKAATLGAGFSLAAAAVHFGEAAVTTRALATIAFLVLTAPVAAHMIGRAAYVSGVPLWEGSVADHLRGHYDVRTGIVEASLGEDAAGDAVADNR